MRKRLTSMMILCAVLVGGDALAQDAVAQRQAAMKDIAASAKTLNQMAKGQSPYDAAAAVAAFTRIRDHAKDFAGFFAAPTPAGVKSSASPRIWEDMPGFQSAAKKLQDDAAAAIQVADDGAGGLGAPLQKVTSNCGSCHETYRVKQ